MLKLTIREALCDNGYGGPIRFINQVLKCLSWDDPSYQGYEIRSPGTLWIGGNKLDVRYLIKDECTLIGIVL